MKFESVQISAFLFTPVRDVKVDVPVKFMAIKEEIPEMIRNQDAISILPVPIKLNPKRIKDNTIPVINPLKANIFTGK